MHCFTVLHNQAFSSKLSIVGADLLIMEVIFWWKKLRNDKCCGLSHEYSGGSTNLGCFGGRSE